MAEINNENVEEVVVEETPATTADNTEKTVFADRVAAKKASIKNPFVRFLYGFVTFFAVWFLDFIDSFKRNPIKLGGYLIALPGIFIGFFMNFEINSVYSIEVTYAPFCMFVLVLCGMINIFEASGIISKKNFSSILIATILSAFITLTGVLFIVDVLNGNKEADEGISGQNIGSFFTIGISIVSSIVGCVIAWIHRDREYKRDKF